MVSIPGSPKFATIRACAEFLAHWFKDDRATTAGNIKVSWGYQNWSYLETGR